MNAFCTVVTWLAVLNNLLGTALAKGLGAVFIPYLIYRLGLRAYFRQKESENGRDRYLRNGADLVAAQMDYALSVYRHNWALALRFLKQCRELKVPAEAEDFFKQFRELDQSYFQIAPAHRLNTLLADQILWEGYQHLFAFVGGFNDMLKADFGIALPEFMGNPDHPKKTAFLAASEEQIFGVNDRATILTALVSRVMDIGVLIENTKMSRPGIAAFRNRPDVKHLLEETRKIVEAQKPKG